MKRKADIWIISQNSGTSKIGGVQRHFFFSKIFSENGYETTIIANSNNHLLKTHLKRGIQKREGVNFYGISTLFRFSSGVFRFLQMIEFGIKCFFLPLTKLPKPDIIILSSMSIVPLLAVLFLKKLYMEIIRKKIASSRTNISENSLFIAIDQEGGKVNRLKQMYGFKNTPSWQHIGYLNNTLITKEHSDSIALVLSNCGLNLNFAPVLDISVGPGEIMYDSERSFSGDEKMVAKHAKIFVDSHKAKGIISCGKHFPGIGSGRLDTHNEKTDISQTWSVKDLMPFDMLIQDDSLDMIMISHAIIKSLDPTYPASLSRVIVNDVLKRDLGFDGLVICDDPSMRAISDNYNFSDAYELMLNAGIDLFCLGNNLNYEPDYVPKSIDAIFNLVKTKKITENRILDAVDRINKIKRKYNIHG